MSGFLEQRRLDLGWSTSVGAQVLLVDADPVSLAGTALRLSPVADLSATTAVHHALEALEAGAQFDALIFALPSAELSLRAFEERVRAISPALARRMLVLTGARSTLDDAVLIARRRLAALGPIEQDARLVPVVRGLLALAARQRLARLGAGDEARLRPAG